MINRFLFLAPLPLLVATIAMNTPKSVGASAANLIPNSSLASESESDSGMPTAPRPSLAVDVVLERVDLANKSQETVGEGIANDDAHQTITLPMLPAQTQNFLAHIKNSGASTTNFQVHFGEPVAGQHAGAPWKLKGWSCYATVDGTTTNILAPLQSKEGWPTPRLQPGAETVLRLSITTASASERPVPTATFRLSAGSDDAVDAVVAHMGVQYMSGLEWSLDGENWKPITKPIVLSALQSVGLRVVAANPEIEWSDLDELFPGWVVHEPWEPHPTNLDGEMIWIHGEAEGTVSFVAKAGNEIEGNIMFTSAKN